MGQREDIAHRQLLSLHETKAVFDGYGEQKCRFRTSLCPDRCGHGGKYAHFVIEEYVKYEKPGEHGDPQGKDFHVMIKDVPPNIVGNIEGLKQGDKVTLNWNHDYCTTTGGSKFPERPITKLEKR
mmetsp:Transcript_10651/g.18261  ORF Transcript_10651/g.18261 Transcript_10651/m.18261 type:complete len:125 (+) Transcript_10651:63-437(+)|eukprot:CAMPEP_0184701464 /NCGR_PEP_ID=MMETSP0313-20130426/20038_1 /TAXON_ID=2792 /ORGANISM="Porphyridium aerugineum, Strain SAG 1380-2" /LENGTH=124 /DNA_ID=CAMNT_0027161537 /DNA_START=52 /DNA_END=426 /DNA_ORIENTATION=-